MRISDWSSDVCSSDLPADRACHARGDGAVAAGRRAALRRGDCQRYARPGGARSGGTGMLSRRGGRATSLSLEAVDVFYGDAQELDGVSLAVAAGALVAIIVANGAGPSTLIQSEERPVGDEWVSTSRYGGCTHP